MRDKESMIRTNTNIALEAGSSVALSRAQLLLRVLFVPVLLGVTLMGCSAPEARVDGLQGVDKRDLTAIQIATSRQLQLGYQIKSIASKDDALDFCHEMCNRHVESCNLSEDLCAYSRAYPEVVALIGRCRVARERCRDHRRRISRQCVCAED